jgi:hypothetical protein
MVKKAKKDKNKKSSVKEIDNKKNESKEIVVKTPVVFPYKEIKVIKSPLQKSLNYCFLSSSKKYIITCDHSLLLFLNPKDFNVLSKHLYSTSIISLMELSDNKLLILDFYQFYIYEITDKCELKIFFHYKNDHYPLGCDENKDGTIFIIYSDCVKYFKREKENKIKLNDELTLGNFVNLTYGDYNATQFKGGFVNEDKIFILDYQEIYIFDSKKKNLIKTLTVSDREILLKYIKLSINFTLIYHKQKLVLLDNKNLEIVNHFYINNDEEEEITCCEGIEKNNLIIYGTNMGKIYIYDYKVMNIIKEICLNTKKFGVYLIKELNNNLIVCNYPQSKIAFVDYISGNIQAELNLKNSSYYRKGIYLETEGKILLGCANNFAIISK